MTSRDQRRHDRAEHAAAAAAQIIDRDDHDLLTYAIKWLPYGGGPDGEILINFGLSKQLYLVRLRDAVDRQLDHIHPQTAARLIQFCDHATDPKSRRAKRTSGSPKPRPTDAVN